MNNCITSNLEIQMNSNIIAEISTQRRAVYDLLHGISLRLEKEFDRGLFKLFQTYRQIHDVLINQELDYKINQVYSPSP